MPEETTTVPNTEELISLWSERTLQEVDERPSIPVAAILGEATDLAELVDAYMHPRKWGAVELPGLIKVVGQGDFSEQIAEEMRQLRTAISAVHSRLKNHLDSRPSVTMEEARAAVSEMRSNLSFVLEDGKHPDGALQVVQLRERERTSGSHDEMALLVEGYVALCTEHADELQRVADFDLSLLEDATQIANGLRLRSAEALVGDPTFEIRALLSTRNRMLHALLARTREVRRVIRFVFRNHPEIVRKSVSEYARDAKRRSLRKASVQDADAAVVNANDAAD